MTEIAPSAFAIEHRTAVMSAAVRPYRWWAECSHAQCGWVGEPWPSAVIAEADGRLHRLANCEHPGAVSVVPLSEYGTSLVCTQCGTAVVVEKDIHGRYLILTASNA